LISYESYGVYIYLFGLPKLASQPLPTIANQRQPTWSRDFLPLHNSYLLRNSCPLHHRRAHALPTGNGTAANCCWRHCQLVLAPLTIGVGNTANWQWQRCDVTGMSYVVVVSGRMPKLKRGGLERIPSKVSSGNRIGGTFGKAGEGSLNFWPQPLRRDIEEQFGNRRYSS
jgi:hypothetical protein